MIYIVTALAQEAIPIIQHLKLKKDLSHTKFDVFKNDTVKLIVSGTGKIKSAIATSYLILKESPRKNDKIVNIGICGSGKETHKSGSLLLVNKIEDVSTGRNYYPEILFNHLLAEETIFTFEKPVLKAKQGAVNGLVDMEASGFFEAANTFVQSHNIILLKVVSDHLSNEKFTGAFIQTIVNKALPGIITILNASRKKAQGSDPEVLEPKEYALFENLSEKLQLSTTQRFQVLDMLKGYKVRSGGDFNFLKDYVKEKKSATKTENKKILEEIMEKLDTSTD